jgi:hypothetical protein
MSSWKETKKIYMQKNAKNVNEFCRCCNASLKVKYGHMEVCFNSELAQANSRER